MLAAVVPLHLILSPASFATVAHTDEPVERLALVRQIWRLGAPTAVVTAVLTAAAAWVTAGAPMRLAGPLALTSGLCSIVSPLQDQVRRTLHTGGRSWAAAMVSAVQLAGVVTAVVLLGRIGVDGVWRPFTALAAANVVSMTFGWLAARSPAPGLPRLALRPLMEEGRWLLAHYAAMAGSFFVATVVVTRLAGAEAVASAEAARLVAQPLFVLAVALNAVTWPASMAAGRAADRPAAVRVRRLFVGVLVAAGAAYGTMTLSPWPGNPFSHMIPGAYAVSGLVLLTVGSNVVLGSYTPYGFEMLGAGRRRAYCTVGLVSGVFGVLASVAAAWWGAYARPLSQIVFSLGVHAGYRRNLAAVYSEAGAETETAAGTHPVTGLFRRLALK